MFDNPSLMYLTADNMYNPMIYKRGPWTFIFFCVKLRKSKSEWITASNNYSVIRHACLNANKSNILVCDWGWQFKQLPEKETCTHPFQKGAKFTNLELRLLVNEKQLF